MHFKWNYEPPTSERQTAAKELGEKISAGHQDGECCKTILPPDA